MKRKLLGIALSCMLGLGVVGCSSGTATKEEVKMSEQQRIESLQGLQGEELEKAYKDLLTKDEIQDMKDNNEDILKNAEYYQKGINLKVNESYTGNEWEAEQRIAEELNACAKNIVGEPSDLICEINWTNNTGNDIQWLSIDYKSIMEDGSSDIRKGTAQNVKAGETRLIKLYLKENTKSVEVAATKIYHVPQVGDPSTIYDGCMPGKWYYINE